MRLNRLAKDELNLLDPEAEKICRKLLPSLVERLNKKLAKYKEGLSAGSESSDVLAAITLDNLGCAATESLDKFVVGCDWFRSASS